MEEGFDTKVVIKIFSSICETEKMRKESRFSTVFSTTDFFIKVFFSFLSLLTLRR